MSRRGLERLEPQRKEEMKVIKDRLMWEDALQAHFENFLQKVEIAKVPDVYTLTFLKAEVEKLEKHVQGSGKTRSGMDRPE
jgi:hypothetical protein